MTFRKESADLSQAVSRAGAQSRLNTSFLSARAAANTK